MIGQRVAHYSIIEKLGAGGMGEVYRARDTRLEREVAIKILPPALAQDPERLARFEREAKVLASLNHPNIAQIHGVEEHALVMELVEGETLKGPLPVETALPYARQIAEALEAAHEKGIIHRDLKPANIMITPAGVVKVLDFGLAKAAEDSPRETGADNSPTLTVSPTRAGTILGTAAYMAPEQARGQVVDRRADIWAFGAVLYEILAGRPAFAGDSVADVLGAVLKSEPDLSLIPARARKLVARCLTKDRRLRLQAIGEARIMIDAPEEERPVRAARTAILPWIAAVIVLAALAAWALLRKPSPEPRPVSRWTEALPKSYMEEGGLAVSRDGRRLAYVMADGKSSSIWLRELDQPEGKPIPGTEGGARPFFSPDGNWIAYWAAWALKKIPVTGGIPVSLCDGAAFFGGSWGEDGRIVFPGGKGLMRVRAAGGACEALTTADPQKGEAHRFPQILPGGKAILFTIGTKGAYDRAQIAMLELKSGGVRVLVNGGSAPRYVPTGRLVYVRSETMFAVPFDLKRLAVTGPEVAVNEGVYFRAPGGFAGYAVSDSGLLLYSIGRPGRSLSALEWRDRQGTAQPLPFSPQAYTSLRLSPDGRRAAVGVERPDGNQDIWNIELERGALTRLTFGAVNHQPEWTPDGRRVVFRSSTDFGLHWTPADGSGKPELLLEQASTIGPAVPVSWTPDGRTLLLQGGAPSRIWALTLPVSGAKPQPLFEAAPARVGEARVSPDGNWVAYTSDESGANQVYVRAFPGPGGKTPVSVAGGQEPRWSRDGRELFYRDPLKNQLMAVEVRTAPAFRAGQPKALFELSTSNWDVAPDARRFLVAKPREAVAAAPQLRIVVNWFDELSQKVPAGKK